MKQKSKSLEELNLIDNFLFSLVMSHEVYGRRTAQIMLSTIIGRDVKIRKLHAEKMILPPDPGLHGIRLDAYVEEDRADIENGEVFDIEPDTKVREKKMLPKRARYYHSRMDGKILEAGKMYNGLPNTWVIFITSFDPFSKGRMVYTIRNRCIEIPEMEYDDGSITLFLNIKGESGKISQDLKELLAYIRETSAEKAVNPKLREIQEGIEFIKADPAVKEAYMTLGEYIQYEREEAAEEANARAEEATARAEEATARADEANARADEANARADEADAEIEKLKAELKKYREASRGNDG